MGLLRAAGVGLSAAGVVLLICRWALLPMTKEHSWVQYLGIGLAIGGSVVVRSLEGRLSRGALAAAAVLGAALGLASFWLFIKPVDAGQVTLVDKKFPGFTMKVPDEDPSIDIASPGSGSFKIERIGGRRGLVEIGWQSGHTEITTEQYADVMGLAAPGMTGKVQSESIEIGGHQGKLMVFPVKEFAVHISVWYCEQHDRDYTLGTMILEPVAEGRAFHGRIADGVQCHIGDKPAVESSRPYVEPTAGYGFVDGSDPATYYNLDGDELAFQPIAPVGAEQIGQKPELVVKMFELVPEISDIQLDGVVAAKAIAKDGSERRVIRVRYKESGEDRRASVTAIPCGGSQSYLGLHSYSKLDKQAAIEGVLLSATCPKGRPPQKHGTVTDVFGRACDSKDGRGCYMLGTLARSKQPPALDQAKKQLGRGCELDHAASCNDLGTLVEAEGQADEAKVLYDKACKLGEPLGCQNAGTTAAE